MPSTDIVSHAFNGVQVRHIIDEHGEPWFVAADVARILGYRDAHNLTRRLDDDEKGTQSVSTPSAVQSVTVITEAGLYVAILGSQVPGAREFKRWVTHELLPTIRRTGSFSLAPQLPQSYADALRELAATVETNAALEAKVAEDAPKVGYVDQFVSQTDVSTLRDVAKRLGWLEKELRAELMRRHWIFEQVEERWSTSKRNYEIRRRYSPYADKARYFHTVPVHEAPRFKGEVMHTLKVTPAGAEAIARTFRLRAVTA